MLVLFFFSLFEKSAVHRDVLVFLPGDGSTKKTTIYRKSQATAANEKKQAEPSRAAQKSDNRIKRLEMALERERAPGAPSSTNNARERRLPRSLYTYI